MHNGLILLSCVCVFWAEAVRVPVRQNEESLRVRIQDPSLGAQEVKLFKELNPTLLVRKQDELVARAIKNIEENSGVHDKEKERILKNYLDQLRRIGEEGYSDIRNKNLDFHQRKVENEGGDAGVAETTKVSKSEGTFDKFYKEPLPDWTTSAQTKQNKEQSEESEEDPYNVEPKGYQQDPDTVLNVRKKKKKRIAPKKSEEEHDVEKPKSYHEDPGPVATRVNYPGQGQWVRRDTRHKPHVTIHKHLYPENVDERGQFEIFDHNKNIYDEEREGYYNDLKKYADNYNTDATNHEEEPQDFVPYRSYSQTRRSEIESRIPRKPKKNKSKRLKEIQKNSKAHTVYTEEGYEDSAYDHGGSEKRGDKLEKDRRVYEEGEGIKEKETRPEAPETSEYEDNREDESETDEVSKRDSFEPERDESESNIKKRRVRKEEIPRRTNSELGQIEPGREIEDTTKPRDLHEEYAKLPKQSSRNEEKLRKRRLKNEEQDEADGTQQGATITREGEPSKYFTFENDDWFQKYRFENIGDYFTVPPDVIETTPIAQEKKATKKEETKPEVKEANEDVKIDEVKAVSPQENKLKKSDILEEIRSLNKQEGTDFQKPKVPEEIRSRHGGVKKIGSSVNTRIVPEETRRTIQTPIVQRRNPEKKLVGEERLRKIQEKRRNNLNQSNQPLAPSINITNQKVTTPADESVAASYQSNQYIHEDELKKSLEKDYLDNFQLKSSVTPVTQPIIVEYYQQIPVILQKYPVIKNIEKNHPNIDHKNDQLKKINEKDESKQEKVSYVEQPKVKPILKNIEMNSPFLRQETGPMYNQDNVVQQLLYRTVIENLATSPKPQYSIENDSRKFEEPTTKNQREREHQQELHPKYETYHTDQVSTYPAIYDLDGYEYNYPKDEEQHEEVKKFYENAARRNEKKKPKNEAGHSNHENENREVKTRNISEEKILEIQEKFPNTSQNITDQETSKEHIELKDKGTKELEVDDYEIITRKNKTKERTVSYPVLITDIEDSYLKNSYKNEEDPRHLQEQTTNVKIETRTLEEGKYFPVVIQRMEQQYPNIQEHKHHERKSLHKSNKEDIDYPKLHENDNSKKSDTIHVQTKSLEEDEKLYPLFAESTYVNYPVIEENDGLSHKNVETKNLGKPLITVNQEDNSSVHNKNEKTELEKLEIKNVEDTNNKKGENIGNPGIAPIVLESIQIKYHQIQTGNENLTQHNVGNNSNHEIKGNEEEKDEVVSPSIKDEKRHLNEYQHVNVEGFEKQKLYPLIHEKNNGSADQTHKRGGNRNSQQSKEEKDQTFFSKIQHDKEQKTRQPDDAESLQNHNIEQQVFPLFFGNVGEISPIQIQDEINYGPKIEDTARNKYKDEDHLEAPQQQINVQRYEPKGFVPQTIYPIVIENREGHGPRVGFENQDSLHVFQETTNKNTEVTTEQARRSHPVSIENVEESGSRILNHNEGILRKKHRIGERNPTVEIKSFLATTEGNKPKNPTKNEEESKDIEIGSPYVNIQQTTQVKNKFFGTEIGEEKESNKDVEINNKRKKERDFPRNVETINENQLNLLNHRKQEDSKKDEHKHDDKSNKLQMSRGNRKFSADNINHFKNHKITNEGEANYPILFLQDREKWKQSYAKIKNTKPQNYVELRIEPALVDENNEKSYKESGDKNEYNTSKNEDNQNTSGLNSAAVDTKPVKERVIFTEDGQEIHTNERQENLKKIDDQNQQKYWHKNEETVQRPIESRNSENVEVKNYERDDIYPVVFKEQRRKYPKFEDESDGSKNHYEDKSVKNQFNNLISNSDGERESNEKNETRNYEKDETPKTIGEEQSSYPLNQEENYPRNQYRNSTEDNPKTNLKKPHKEAQPNLEANYQTNSYTTAKEYNPNTAYRNENSNKTQEIIENNLKRQRPHPISFQISEENNAGSRYISEENSRKPQEEKSNENVDVSNKNVESETNGEDRRLRAAIIEENVNKNSPEEALETEVISNQHYKENIGKYIDNNGEVSQRYTPHASKEPKRPGRIQNDLRQEQNEERNRINEIKNNRQYKNEENSKKNHEEANSKNEDNNDAENLRYPKLETKNDERQSSNEDTRDSREFAIEDSMESSVENIRETSREHSRENLEDSEENSSEVSRETSAEDSREDTSEEESYAKHKKNDEERLKKSQKREDNKNYTSYKRKYPAKVESSTEENYPKKRQPNQRNEEISLKPQEIRNNRYSLQNRNFQTQTLYPSRLLEAQPPIRRRSSIEATPKTARNAEESEDYLIDIVMGEEKFGKKLRRKRSVEESKEENQEKYPNYKSKELDKTSSFRYAEGPENILVKETNKMVLYDRGEEDIECPELEDINPVPEKAKNPKNETANSNHTDYDPKTRIKGKLSDQIDCLKRRYFGDNPLDNPLFEEEYDETVSSSVVNETRNGKAIEKNSDSPRAEPYVMRRKIIRRRPQNPIVRGNFERKRPQRYQQQDDRQKYFSEVHYKEEIKPSEQLNVFADIINNIKSSKQDTNGSESKKEEIYIGRKPNDAKNRYHRFRTTTSKPFLPTPLPTERRKTSPIRILPEHIDADEIIIVKKKPPKRHNTKQIQGTEKDNFASEEASVNKFYYTGLRPPPKKPYNHPNLYNPDLERRRNSSLTRRRTKRSHGYAEIKRSKDEIDDEIDDYVPKRERNFHYDEKTGKIVYDNKQEKSEEDRAEYDYVEIQEPTHPPAKKKEELKRFPPTPPPGPSYLDYIKILKNDSNYTVIEDPKPSEKEDMAENAVTSSESSSVASLSTGLPDYLSILNKIKSDKSYKVYLDPTPETKRKKTGKKDEEKGAEEETAEAEIQEEELEGEEGGIQNSPGVQGILAHDSTSPVFDSSDFVPKTKDYVPRTSIDTSKYTNIRRNPVRNREEPETEQRSSEEAERKKENDVAEEKEIIYEEVLTTTPQSQTIEIPTTSAKPTTPIERPSARYDVKTRRTVRRRPTSPQEATTASTSFKSTQRRQRGRTRVRSTTPSSQSEEGVRNRRNLQRKNYEIPRNHRRDYAKTRNDLESFKPTPRSITFKVLNQTDIAKLVNGSSNEESAPENVEVFDEFDKGKKHGGNYKYKKVQIKITRNYKPERENEEEASINPKEFYNDPKLAERINKLKERNNYELMETFIQEENTGDDDDESDEETTEKVDVTTKKVPNIIKDPSKRLYFYAPI